MFLLPKTLPPQAMVSSSLRESTRSRPTLLLSQFLGDLMLGLEKRASEDPLLQSGKYISSFASENHLPPENLQWLYEKYLPTYGFGSSFLDSSSLLNRIPSSSSLDPPRAAEACKKFNSNSSYDYYVSQLASSSTDSMSYKLHAASIALTPLYDQAGETVSSTDCGISEAAFSTIQRANPCRINLDYFDCVSDEQKESRTHENIEGNYSYWSIGANNMKRDNSATISSPPCWKGAPSSHNYPLDIGVKEHSDKFAKGQSSFSDLQQGQSGFPC